MINFKYGTGFSLLQSNGLGLVDPENPVTAGQVAYIDPSTGMIEPGVPASNAAATERRTKVLYSLAALAGVLAR